MREQVPFLLSGPDIYFAPFFAPDRISNAKERNLSREENFCGGEDVTDIGSTNRTIHIKGRLLKSELSSFDNIVDSNDPLRVIMEGWSGEVRIEMGEWEGPVGWEPQAQEKLFQYTFDFVSTGAGENSDGYEDGIIDDGFVADNNGPAWGL
jgi:hypothetical protein